MNTHDIELRSAIMGAITDVWDRAKQIDDAADEVLDLIEASYCKRRGEPVSSEAYDKIDYYLRNNLYDDDYAEYSEALDAVYCGPPPAEPSRGEPVAWRYWNEKSRSWNETSSASVAAAMQEGGRSVEPLYPVAMPAPASDLSEGQYRDMLDAESAPYPVAMPAPLLLPEPMTDERVRYLLNMHIRNDTTHLDLIRDVEAEVIRRVKEANK